jgi:hypothetical protein
VYERVAAGCHWGDDGGVKRGQPDFTLLDMQSRHHVRASSPRSGQGWNEAKSSLSNFPFFAKLFAWLILLLSAL